MKKIIALVLTLCMVLMVGAAFAAGTALTTDSSDTGEITISQSTNTVSVAGREFHAFKVLDATIATVNDTTSVAYTVPDYMKAFFDAEYATDLAGITYPSAAYDAVVTGKIGAYTSDSSTFIAFAEKIQTYCKNNVDYYTATGAEGATKVEFKNLPLGYYIVADMSEASETNTVSAVILDTTKPKADIVVKATTTEDDKSITGVKTGEEGEDNKTTFLTDEDGDGKYEVSDTSIGDIIHYQVDSAVPDVRGYNVYKFVVNDSLDKGLKLDKSSIKLTIGTGADAVVYTAPDNLTVTTDPETPTGEAVTTLKIVLKDALTKFTGKKDQPIAITYDAELTKDAIIGQEVDNHVTIAYSNNPNYDYSGDDFSTTDPKGITPEKKTKTFTTEITIRKVDQDGNTLSGVGFTLTGKTANIVVEYYEKFVVDENGSYYELNDGTYTTSAPGSVDPVTGKTFAVDQYKDTNVKYKLVHDQFVKTDDENSDRKVEAVTGENGTITFTGLSEGKYTITETIVPDGYTGVDPFDVTIDFSYDKDTGKGSFTATGTGVTNDGDNTFTVSVVNKTGVVLPSTGGIGTTIFYILGGLLVVGAAVILVARRKAQD